MLPVEQPFKTYTGLDGKPLDDGFVYFGQPSQDPIAHPVTVFWDAAGTLPAAQPLRTVNGYIMRAGAPANVFFGGAYSELVLDSKSRQVFYAPDSNQFSVFTPVSNLLAQVQASMGVLNQPGTGHLWVEDGARVNRITDRLFVGDGAVLDGRAVPIVSTWLGTVSGGVYEYLESNATLIAPATAQGVGIFGAARTSPQSGTAGAAAIGLAGFSYNDKVGGAGGAWGLYSTVIRAAGANGPTHGLEIDVANMGTTVIADPFVINPAGLTNGARICAGGETIGTGVCTYALGIIQNDGAATPTAKFEKGIVFHATAIAGTDGVSGTGTAIALAKGHTLTWYNAGHHETSYIYSAVGNEAAGQGLIFTDSGTNIVSVADGSLLFQIAATSGAKNAVQVQAASAGQAPQLTVTGIDADIDFKLGGKGTGLIHFVQSTVTPAGSAGTPTISNYLSIKVNGVSFKLPLYS